MVTTDQAPRASPQLSRRQVLRGALGLLAAASVPRELLRLPAPAARPRGLPAPGEPEGTLVVRWNSAALDAIRATRFGPPITARALAIVHTCMYDAWTAYTPVARGTHLDAPLRQPPDAWTPANKAQAISYAAYRALADLYPTEAPAFTDLVARLGYDPGDTSEDPTTPSGIGNLVAKAALAFRHADGANQLGDLHPGAYSDTTGYTPVNGPDQLVDPNRWQPLRVPDGSGGVVEQTFTAPHWGQVVPFALPAGDVLRPRSGPARYPSVAYQLQAREILAYSAHLTDTAKVIVDYWRDGPRSEQPPGHWCLFAQEISQRDKHDLDADVQLFFILANALLDTSIACWDAKRAFDSPRPITAIRFLYRGRWVRAWGGPYQGTQLIRGETWQPYQPATVVTPPFPEHVSGHSAFSAASAEILRRWTGSDAFGATVVQPAGSSALEPGAVPAQDVRLTWATFSDAADQAGFSRRLGGIHFLAGDMAGRSLGRAVAARVWDAAQRLIHGQPVI